MTLGCAMTMPLDLGLRSPAGTTTMSRSLPLTWTGSSLVSAATSAGSTPATPRVWIERHGRPGRRQAARPQLLGDVRRDRRQHQQQQPDRLVPAGAPGDLACRGSASAGWSAP